MTRQSLTRTLALDFADQSPAALYRRRNIWTQRARHLSQLAFGLFIITGSVIHHLATEDGTQPSIDALCPFGGIETLWRYVSSGGQYVPKTHASNLILLGGLVIGTLIAGGAFCGWICPFGAAQDLLTALRKRLHIPELHVPERLDRVLRYARFALLAVILYQTIISVKLIFADADPYRTLFSLDWLFEFDLATHWPAYAITLAVLAVSFVVERAWCRYLCPLGGVISVLSRFSLLRIKREAHACKGCALCERPCPVKLNVATADVVSSNCIGCLQCVDSCPKHDTLAVRLAPRKATGAITRWAMPVAAVVLLVGAVAGAQTAGLWSTSGRTAVNLTQLAPADIKGWMTLRQVIDGTGIPQAELYRLASVPADTPASTALKELEKIVDGFEVSSVRDAVGEWAAAGGR
jgi:polyferredoxin